MTDWSDLQNPRCLQNIGLSLTFSLSMGFTVCDSIDLTTLKTNNVKKKKGLHAIVSVRAPSILSFLADPVHWKHFKKKSTQWELTEELLFTSQLFSSVHSTVWKHSMKAVYQIGGSFFPLYIIFSLLFTKEKRCCSQQQWESCFFCTSLHPQ